MIILDAINIGLESVHVHQYIIGDFFSHEFTHKTSLIIIFFHNTQNAVILSKIR